jgi:hypothetical protein
MAIEKAIAERARTKRMRTGRPASHSENNAFSGLDGCSRHVREGEDMHTFDCTDRKSGCFGE